MSCIYCFRTDPHFHDLTQPIFAPIPVKSVSTFVPKGKPDTASRIEPIGETVSRLLMVDPAKWEGEYHIYVGGKTGELIFLLAVLQPVLDALPNARIVVHILGHYLQVTRLFHLSDRISFFVEKDESYEAWHMGRGNMEVHFVHGNNLHVNAYRLHSWFPGTRKSSGVFYRSFAEATGALPFVLQPLQSTIITRYERKRTALAFPNTNQHSSQRRKLPFKPEQWLELSKILQSKGLECYTNGSKSDPDVETPGWEKLDIDLDEAVWIANNADFVIGANSGIVWNVLLNGKARIIMLDETRPCVLYASGRMSGDMDTNRIEQIYIDSTGYEDSQTFNKVVAHVQSTF